MEQLAVRPKPKQTKPPHPPPKPPKPVLEINDNAGQRERRRGDGQNSKVPLRPSDEINKNFIHQESQTPIVPARPTDKELSHTVYHRKLKAREMETKQSGRVESTAQAPEVPPKPMPEVKGSVLGGMFRKSQKEHLPTFTTYVLHTEEHSDTTGKKQEEDGLFSGKFRESLQMSYESEENLVAQKELSASNDSLSDQSHTKEKKGVFGGMLKKLKLTETAEEDKKPLQRDLSASDDSLNNNAKEKGGLFGGLFKKPLKSSELSASKEDQIDEQGNVSASDDSLSGNKMKRSPPLDKKLSASNEDLSGQTTTKLQEKAGVFGGLFKKPLKSSEVSALKEDQMSEQGELSASNDSLSGINNVEGSTALHKKLAVSNEDLSDHTTKKEKGFFGGLFQKSLKSSETSASKEDQIDEQNDLSTNFSDNTNMKDSPSLRKKLSASNEELSDQTTTKEKGGLFGGLFKKPLKSSELSASKEDQMNEKGELSASNDSLSGNNNVEGSPSLQKKLSASNEELSDQTAKKEKGGLFGGLFKKTHKSSEFTALKEGDVSTSSDSLSDDSNVEGNPPLHKKLSASNDELSDQTTVKEKAGLFGGLFKKPLKSSGLSASKEDLMGEQGDISASNDSLSDNSNMKEKKGIFSGMFKKPKPTGEDEKTQDLSISSESLSDTTKKEESSLHDELSTSKENLIETSHKEKGGVFSHLFKKSPNPESSNVEEDSPPLHKKLSASYDDLSEVKTTKDKPKALGGMFQRSPKPLPRFATDKDPLTLHRELSASNDSLSDIDNTKESLQVHKEHAGSADDLSDNNNAKEKKGVLRGIFRRTPKPDQQGETGDQDESDDRRVGRNFRRKKRVVSFRVKRTLPRMPSLSLNSEAKNSDQLPILEEPLEMQKLPPLQEGNVELEQVEMAPFPSEENPLDTQDNDDLMDWWMTVEGWESWTKTAQDDEEEVAVESAADRVYMAARLFVKLFNQRGASLQQRILELLSQADAADEFHKKTVSASLGGSVASVAGSVATITGLILAPFTFGTSIIVTAVGISVATAGSITSATANLTDTVHSKMDSKKVEKMIQGYQDEIRDIRECLQFVQDGMDTLQEWNFEKYSEAISKKHLSHNIKHVLKEGGRAGKALMVNTDNLIKTIQVLGVAGGAAKAAQAISVTTGVMSALFLALDVFFLAKDSHELRKGAKTKFATKIREMCKDLQDGLLELNKVKSQLQKTMDGIEVEEYEEEGEEEEEEEDDLVSDPVKLAELEQELDQIEEQLDKKTQQKQPETNHKGEREKERGSTSERENERGSKIEKDGDLKSEDGKARESKNEREKGLKSEEEKESKLKEEKGNEMESKNAKDVRKKEEDLKSEKGKGSKITTERENKRESKNEKEAKVKDGKNEGKTDALNEMEEKKKLDKADMERGGRNDQSEIKRREDAKMIWSFKDTEDGGMDRRIETKRNRSDKREGEKGDNERGLLEKRNRNVVGVIPKPRDDEKRHVERRHRESMFQEERMASRTEEDKRKGGQTEREKSVMSERDERRKEKATEKGGRDGQSHRSSRHERMSWEDKDGRGEIDEWLKSEKREKKTRSGHREREEGMRGNRQERTNDSRRSREGRGSQKEEEKTGEGETDSKRNSIRNDGLYI